MTKLFAWLLLVVVAQAGAQVPPPPPQPQPTPTASTPFEPFQEFGKRIKAASMVEPLGSALFGDQVSLYNGGTEFSVVDVDLPGNNALKVQVARRFKVEERRGVEDRPGFGEWELDVPYLHGVYTHAHGWTAGQNSTNRCELPFSPPTTSDFTPEEFWHGASLHLPGQGDMELLVNDQSSLPAISGVVSHPWITKGFIRLRCKSTLAPGSPGQGQGFVAITPDGVQYTFDWMIVRETASLTKPFANGGNPLLRDRVYLMATEVRDRFDNTVTYGYTGDKLTTITSSDGRSITLDYGTDDLIDTVRVNSTPVREWDYAYQFSNLPPGVPESLLTSVVRPDGSAWSYEVTAGGFAYIPSGLKSGDPGTCPEPALPKQGTLQYKITHPAGAIGTFDFSFRRHYRVLWDKLQVICVGQETYYTLQFPNYFDVWSLDQKTLSGLAVDPAMTWTYAYGDNAGLLVPCPSCAATKDVVVTEPDGAKVISRFGVLFEVNEGRLLGEEVKSPGGLTLRNTVHDYASSAGTYPDIYGTSLITGFDPVANRIRPLIGTTIAQQGKNFDVDHSNFDVFGRARDHTRSSNLTGNPTKTERTTFHDNYDIWVLGQPARTVLLSSPEIEISETTYDATFALPQTQEVFGRLDRSFEWHLIQDATHQKGKLKKLKDAENRAYELSNYYRGVPRSIELPTSASDTMTATVDYFGNVTTVTDAEDFTTGYQYDEMDRLKQIDWPIADTVTWQPTVITYAPTTSSEHGVPSGLWKRTETTGTLVKETWFDAFWRPILDRESASDASTTPTFLRRKFDHRNRQALAAYPLASLTGGHYLNATVGSTSTFDALDRTISIVGAAEAPHNSVTTSFFYDPNFITRIRDARGFETSTSFLAWDSPSTEFPTVITAPAGQTTTILRDVFGKPRKLTRSGVWNSNLIAVDRDYVYDAHQRLCKTIELESQATVVEYDTVNQIAWTAIGQELLSTIDCERGSVEQKSTHRYDAMNRLTSIDHPPGTEDVAYTYFADGALQTASTVPQLTFPPDPPATPTTTWTYVYNKRRLLELETLNYDSRSFELDWSYNDRGQILSLGYPDDESVDWNPDARGRPRRAMGIAGTYATVISRHPNGAVSNLTYGNSQLLTTTQNTRQLPWARVVGSLMNYTLTYDQNANLTGIVDAIPVEEQDEPPPAPPRIKFLDTRNMVYDGLNRMTQANAPDVFGAETYVYDPLDNVRSASFGSVTHTFTYDADTNRLDRIDSDAAEPFSVDYNYNLQGDTTLRLISTPSGGAIFADGFETRPAVPPGPGRTWVANLVSTQTLLYDRAHRLTGVAGLENYVYDAHGHRVAIIRAGDSNRRYQIYSRDGRFLYTDDYGEIVDYIHLDGELVAERRPPVGGVPLIVRYHHTDMRGSSVVQSNTAGTQVRRTIYEPYGATRSGTYIDGPGFTGHATDASTGLTYMQQRYYDPIAFRFMSPDPVPSNAASFNIYWYANNNPMNFVDPDGRNAVTALGGLAYESVQFVQGNGFDGASVMGALADGYNGEGDGFASAAFQDATSLIPAGAVAGAAIKVSRLASQAGKISNVARANKINHIFSQARHNLAGVAKALGGESKAFKAIEKATGKAVDTSKAGRFETTVKIGGEQVTVRGSVVDGKVKIGTAFVKEELKK